MHVWFVLQVGALEIGIIKCYTNLLVILYFYVIERLNAVFSMLLLNTCLQLYVIDTLVSKMNIPYL